MKENPYSLILGTLKQDNNTSNGVTIGNVISPNPLVVQVGDLQIDKDNILISHGLNLVKGDKIAVFPTQDKQIYIILARLKEV